MQSSFTNYNDYELIEYVKSGFEDAFDVMVKKYSKFISKKIHKYNLAHDYEDCYQEGINLLYRSIIRFEEKYNKTFTRYFELNLERHLVNVLRKQINHQQTIYNHVHEITETHHAIEETSVYFPLFLETVKSILTEKEWQVYHLREIKNYSIEWISKELALPYKSVYNACHRAKIKIHAYFKE